MGNANLSRWNVINAYSCSAERNPSDTTKQIKWNSMKWGGQRGQGQIGAHDVTGGLGVCWAGSGMGSHYHYPWFAGTPLPPSTADYSDTCTPTICMLQWLFVNYSPLWFIGTHTPMGPISINVCSNPYPLVVCSLWQLFGHHYGPLSLLALAICSDATMTAICSLWPPCLLEFSAVHTAVHVWAQLMCLLR